MSEELWQHRRRAEGGTGTVSKKKVVPGPAYVRTAAERLLKLTPALKAQPPCSPVLSACSHGESVML